MRALRPKLEELQEDNRTVTPLSLSVRRVPGYAHEAGY